MKRKFHTLCRRLIVSHSRACDYHVCIVPNCFQGRSTSLITNTRLKCSSFCSLVDKLVFFHFF